MFGPVSIQILGAIFCNVNVNAVLPLSKRVSDKDFKHYLNLHMCRTCLLGVCVGGHIVDKYSWLFIGKNYFLNKRSFVTCLMPI